MPKWKDAPALSAPAAVCSGFSLSLLFWVWRRSQCGWQGAVRVCFHGCDWDSRTGVGVCDGPEAHRGRSPASAHETMPKQSGSLLLSPWGTEAGDPLGPTRRRSLMTLPSRVGACECQIHRPHDSPGLTLKVTQRLWTQLLPSPTNRGISVLASKAPLNRFSRPLL